MIKFSFNVPAKNEADINSVVASKLKVPFKSVTVLKKSLDARKKGNIVYNYTVAVETEFEDKAVRNGGTVYNAQEISLEKTVENIRYKGSRPVVIGAGPCGLFAALTLCLTGATPIILERGEKVEDRVKTVEKFNSELVLNTESNIQFGEGGAGTFSDGKLNTGINSPLVPVVLKVLCDCGAPEEITYLNKPHVGTDKLRAVVGNLRKKIEAYGGEFHFNTKAVDFIIKDGVLKGVRTDKGDFFTDRAYLCIGHSARDTFYTLYGKGIYMVPKVFSMGVRIEHLQETIDISQYGAARGKLPPADYKTAVKLSNGGNLYTFCMCPGGTVVNASSEVGRVCVNGMSDYLRNGENANSALLINVGVKEYGEGALAGVELQRKIERLAFKASNSYRVPVQTYGGFLRKKVTEFGSVKPSAPLACAVDLNSFLPDFIKDGLKEGIPLIAKKIRGFDSAEAVLSGVEARSSSPVRIQRDEKCNSSVKGLYPLGEGAGYAGGITSAAADGIRGVISSL